MWFPGGGLHLPWGRNPWCLPFQLFVVLSVLSFTQQLNEVWIVKVCFLTGTMTEITAEWVTCTAKLLTLLTFTKAVWQVQETNLLVPTPLDKCVWCSTLLEGLTNASGTCFQSGGATWPGTSLDPESGVTVLIWYCVQANDSLLVQLIILSAGEH